MPKLLVFAPCEKVIISQDENNPTLITVLTEISGEYESEMPIEPTSVGPMRWAIFTMWQPEEGEEVKELEQRIQLLSPSRRKAFDVTHPFSLTARTHRMIANLGTIPIGENGEWTLEMFVHEKGEPPPNKPWATYPLKIRMERRQSPASTDRS